MLSLLVITLSMIIIWRVSDGFETASQYLGRNLSDGVRGATINAIGSSIPELLTTLIALLIYNNKSGFSFGIGTTAGSAVFNSMVIPALVILTVVTIGLVKEINVSKKVVLRDGVSLLVAEALLIYILSGYVLTWVHGLILVMMYLGYMLFTLITMKNTENDDSDVFEDTFTSNKSRTYALLTGDLTTFILWNKSLSTKNAWILLTTATAFISLACWLLVEACYSFGDYLGIQVYFISVLLAAAATSVPDTILSIKDARSGNYDDALSNAIGSNIFDICICLGLPLFVYCLFTGSNITISSTSQGNVAELRVLLFLLTFCSVLIFYVGKGMGWIKANFLIGLYILFTLFIILRAKEYPLAIEIGNTLQEILKFFGG